MHKRIAVLGAAAAALVAVAAGPVAAADINTETVTAVGSSGGVVVRCPHGWTSSDERVTNADGSPLAPDQRWHMTPIVEDGVVNGVAAWIAPYDDSPPPPDTIAVTTTCTNC